MFILTFTTLIFAQSVTVEIEELPTKSIQQSTPIPKLLMIDNFEDGDLVKFREWWNFDKIFMKTVNNEDSETLFIENISLEISGASNNWYAGGIGTYLNEDASYFSTLKLVIFSPKMNSGAIRIELYDDDNNNKIVDIDKATNTPSKDDIFIYDINITWEGWKVVSIPLSDFVDFNPEIGDNTWNPNKNYGSSGLVQMQLVILSSKFKSETINFKIDTIKFN
ncbi:MAG: hypothetical protein VW397_08805 [Candidatus Margulisiibacteriota bacterium]